MSQDVFDGLVPFNGTDGLAPRYMVEEAALHEAGHAVAAAVLLPPGSIVLASLLELLDLQAEANGRVRIYSEPVAQVGLNAFGVYSYAGVAATSPCLDLEALLPEVDFLAPIHHEEITDDHPEFGDIWDASEHDRVSLEIEAVRLFDDARVGRGWWHLDYWRDAQALINAHADAIAAVAKELFVHGYLTGQQIESLVMGSPPVPW